ncbi:MAG TPA: hypothetical protein VMV87_09395 [Burkholderiales bacterium]|nr:hypothetical protein [Burkholderiales bacterium]
MNASLTLDPGRIRRALVAKPHHTRLAGVERFLECAYARLHHSHRAHEHGQSVA